MSPRLNLRSLSTRAATVSLLADESQAPPRFGLALLVTVAVVSSEPNSDELRFTMVEPTAVATI